MKRIIKLACVLGIASMAIAACKKDNGTTEGGDTTAGPVVSLSADSQFTNGSATITATLDKVNPDKATKVTLAVDQMATTFPSSNVTVPTSVIVKKGELKGTATASFQSTGLEAGDYVLVLKATEATNGATIGTANSVSISATVTGGGDNPGGDTPGGDTPGGDTPGGDTPGGDTPGGDTPQPGSKVKVIDFSNPSNSVWTLFGNDISLSSGYTFILHFYADKFVGQTYLGKFSDKKPQSANCNNVVRFGEVNGKAGSLEWSINQNERMNTVMEFQTGTWYSIALVTTSDAKRMIYVDGSKVDVTTVQGQAISDGIGSHPGLSAAKFGAIEWGDSWGTSGGDARPFPGSICMISVWNKGLSADEVAALVKTAPSTDAEGLVAYWPMTEGSGHVLTDASGKGLVGNIDFSNNWVEYGSGKVADCAAAIEDSWRELDF